MAELSRRELLRRVGAGGLVLALPGAAAGPVFAAREREEAAPDTVNWALGATIRSLDFVHSFDVTTAIVLSLGLEGLLVYGNDGSLKPNLAVSWSHPDALTYVYKLRPGVKFWDGSPLTAEDVVFSMSQHTQKKVGSQLASYYASVKSITARGDSVVVKLKTPDPFFQYVPAFQAGYIIQKRFALEHEKNIGSPGVLTMGTGPYRFTKYVPDDSVTLDRNDAYWGRKGAIRQLNLKFIVEDSTRLLAMRSGQIDGTFTVPVQQIDQWSRLQDVKLQFAPELRVAAFSFDVSAPPWNDVHVRRAFAHCLDRPGLVKAVLGGHGAPANAVVPPQQWGGVASQARVLQLYSSLARYPFSIAAAKAELAKSSMSGGFSATVTYPDSRQPLGKASLAVAENLKELGITLEVKQATTDAWLNGLYAHEDLGIQVFSFGADYPDPANFPTLLYDSKYAVKNAFNLANYKNPTVDRLLALQQRSPSAKVRANAIASVLKIVARDLPFLPIWWQEITMATKSSLRYDGFSPWYYTQPWALHLRAA